MQWQVAPVSIKNSNSILEKISLKSSCRSYSNYKLQNTKECKTNGKGKGKGKGKKATAHYVDTKAFEDYCEEAEEDFEEDADEDDGF